MLYLTVIVGVASLCCLAHTASVAISYVSHKDCNGVPHGTFIAHPGNCHQFVHCRGLRSILGECPHGTYFNPTVYSCDRSRRSCDADKLHKLQLKEQQQQQQQHQKDNDDNVPQQQNSATDVQTTTVATTTVIQKVPNKILNVAVAVMSTTTTPYQPVGIGVGASALYGRPVCMYWLDQQLPHPVNCEYYYNCQRGYLTIRRCYNGLGWDLRRQRCIPMSEAICYARYLRPN